MEISDLIITDKQTLQKMINVAVEKAIVDNADKFSNESKNDLYTTKQVAEKLNIAESTLANYRKEGKIGYIQKGAWIRYTKKHLQDFIEENEVG